MEVIQKFKSLRKGSYKKLAALAESVVSTIYCSDQHFDLPPFDNERFERPAGKLIDTKRFQRSGGVAHGFDDRRRLVLRQGVEQGETSFEHFVEWRDDVAWQYCFNSEKAPVGVHRVAFEDGRAVRREAASKGTVLSESFHYDRDSRLERVVSDRGDLEKPHRYTIVDRFFYDGDIPVRIEHDFGTGHIEVTKLKPSKHKPATLVRLLKERLVEVLEQRLTALSLQGAVLAVALAYDDGAPVDGPYVGAIDEAELRELVDRLDGPLQWLNPAEWSHYDSAELAISDPAIDDIVGDIRALADPPPLGPLLVQVSKQLRKRLNGDKSGRVSKQLAVYATSFSQADLLGNLRAANPTSVVGAWEKRGYL